LQTRAGAGPSDKRITAKALKLDIPELNLPALEVDASLSSDGALNSVALYNAERKLSVKLEPKGGERESKSPPTISRCPSARIWL